jgi:hypothetical protein
MVRLRRATRVDSVEASPLCARRIAVFESQWVTHYTVVNSLGSSGKFSASTGGVGVVAFYLPQCHPKLENDECWDKGDLLSERT